MINKYLCFLALFCALWAKSTIAENVKLDEQNIIVFPQNKIGENVELNGLGERIEALKVLFSEIDELTIEIDSVLERLAIIFETKDALVTCVMRDNIVRKRDSLRKSIGAEDNLEKLNEMQQTLETYEIAADKVLKSTSQLNCR